MFLLNSYSLPLQWVLLSYYFIDKVRGLRRLNIASKITQPRSNGDELETLACFQKMEENNILHRT